MFSILIIRIARDTYAGDLIEYRAAKPAVPVIKGQEEANGCCAGRDIGIMILEYIVNCEVCLFEPTNKRANGCLENVLKTMRNFKR